MKIILSRKGLDSENGGYPSPIMPDGRMMPLPIPSCGEHSNFSEICSASGVPADLLSQLSRGRFNPRRQAHLDPDLRRNTVPRRRGWRALYGAGEGGGATVLRNKEVGRGDLFLFFGWFRQTMHVDGCVRYMQGAPDIHALFGWMHVDRVVDASKGCPEDMPWGTYFSHFVWRSGTVFVASKKCTLAGASSTTLGAGTFTMFRDGLQLTAPKHTRSVWTLPKWFWPGKDKPALGYHENRKRWQRKGGRVILQSAARGQEFVLDTAHYPAAEEWARNLIEDGDAV